MYPPTVAVDRPDAVAYVMAASGHSLTYSELDRRSNQLTHLWRATGVTAGDTVVIAMENNIEWPVVVAAGMRSGLYVTPVNWHLKDTEMAALIVEATPTVVVTSALLAGTVEAALNVACRSASRLSVDPDVPGFAHLDTELADLPTTPIDDELMGARVLYSGGTTGRPKAFRQRLLGVHPKDAPVRHAGLVEKLEINGDTVFLSPAPNYHAAPFTFGLMTLAAGGTVVCMEKFDAAGALTALSRYSVTHSQWVPTMLLRMLRIRDTTDVHAPSHRVAFTSGAPCPIAVKDQIDAWWGPILHEYYGASEGFGHTYISPLEARERPGSVGRPLGATVVHISGTDSSEQPAGEVGKVCFEPTGAQDYSNTGDAADTRGWREMGDIGYLDDDGYLYLVGREGFMIISGGVNIYPDEIEAVLLSHPDVVDAAVIGVPHAEFGEQVKAIVETFHQPDRPPVTEDSLIVYCRDRLAGYKAPKIIEFTTQLPRLPTGKLNKRQLRESSTSTPVPASTPSGGSS